MSRSAGLKEDFSKSFQRGIQSLEGDSCQVSAEWPVDPFPRLIAFGLPSIDLRLQGFTSWDPVIQALGTKHCECTCGPIEPPSMLGGVVKLHLVGDPARFSGCKCFAECGGCMRIEIIHYQPAQGRLGKINVDQPVPLLGQVLFGAARGTLTWRHPSHD